MTGGVEVRACVDERGVRGERIEVEASREEKYKNRYKEIKEGCRKVGLGEERA